MTKNFCNNGLNNRGNYGKTIAAAKAWPVADYDTSAAAGYSPAAAARS